MPELFFFKAGAGSPVPADSGQHLRHSLDKSGCILPRVITMGKVPAIVERGRRMYRRMSVQDGMDLELRLHYKAQDAKKAKDFDSFLKYSLQTLNLIEKKIARYREDRRKFGGEHPLYSHGILDACRLLPILGTKAQLNDIRELVDHYPDFDKGLLDLIQRSFEDFETVQTACEYIENNPGTKQNQLKAALGYRDGRHLATLVKDLATVGKIERRVAGKTHELFIGQKSSIVDKAVAPKPEAPQNADPIPTIKGGESKRRPWWKRK